MQYLSLLINKYREGTASVKELQELLDLLDKQEKELYREWEAGIKKNIIAGDNVSVFFDPAISKAALLSKLQTKNVAIKHGVQDSKVRQLFKRNTAVAAACIALLAMISWYYWVTRPDFRDDIMNQEFVISKATIIHAGDEAKTIALEDGSKVFLYEGSTLEYDSTYNKSLRKLVLNGKARFSVKKDKQKPFAVYTKNNITTALGTVFEVTAVGDSTIVHLLEGSVKVQQLGGENNEAILLAPQQRSLTHNGQTALIREKREKTETIVNSIRTENAPGSSLNFKQVPLEKVLTTLEKKYKVKIQFNQAAINGMLFTGSFQEQEELKNILTIITTINNLTITANDQGFSITK